MINHAPKVTLLIPGLLEPFSGIDPSLFPDLPALTKLLSKGCTRQTENNNYETTLCDLFNIYPDNNNELPIAQLTWLTDSGSPSNTALLRADPVHLRADQAELRLFPANQLSITASEAKQLINSLNEHYHADGIEFIAPTLMRWYVRLKRQPSLKTHPLSCVAGNDIRHYLPAGKDAAYWKGLFNEIQMLLHDHTVNINRRDNQQAAINSLWFWGGAPIEKIARPSNQLVMSNDVLAESLAKFTGSRFVYSDIDIEIACDTAAEDKSSILIAHNDFLDSIACADFNSWSQMLEKFEQELFTPLLSALKKGKIVSVTVLPCNRMLYQVRRNQLLHFWKPVKSLKSFAGKF